MEIMSFQQSLRLHDADDEFPVILGIEDSERPMDQLSLIDIEHEVLLPSFGTFDPRVD
jgi:hypothetical protein